MQIWVCHYLQSDILFMDNLPEMWNIPVSAAASNNLITLTNFSHLPSTKV